MLPMVVKPLGDSTIVARTPVLSSDACNGSFIIISSTLEDGGVERTKNLQEVSAPTLMSMMKELRVNHLRRSRERTMV